MGMVHKPTSCFPDDIALFDGAPATAVKVAPALTRFTPVELFMNEALALLDIQNAHSICSSAYSESLPEGAQARSRIGLFPCRTCQRKLAVYKNRNSSQAI
jgi:hypothetical protein